MPTTTATEIRPFQIQIDDAVLTDLRQRLAQTRWPDEIPGANWDYGSNLTYIQELCRYWQTQFDWRAQEKKLNNFNHYKTIVDGLDLHFIREKGQGPNPIPLIITHGWPSTFFEMTKIIPLLANPAAHGADPADAFDVIAPSLPGFGFSQASPRPGMEIGQVADLWAKLMTQNLGYPRFAAAGGDIGAGVTARLGYSHADQLHGIHLTSVTRPAPYLGPGARPLTPAETAHSAQRERWFQDEGGYNHLQGTKPQTLSYGLNDSPAGLCAWIVEKWRTWSDLSLPAGSQPNQAANPAAPSGSQPQPNETANPAAGFSQPAGPQANIETAYTKDELLTTATIYWATATIGSSVRMYKENQRELWTLAPNEKVPAPAGFAMFPQEIARPPREWAERSYHVRQWQEMPRGGHFAAFEQPHQLAQEIRQFYRQLR